MISVKLFGISRDIIGASSITIEAELKNVSELLSYLKEKYPDFAKLTSLLVAVNDEYADPEVLLKGSDEVAIIPPVSGG